MQTIVQVKCTRGESMRSLIERDGKLARHGLQVILQHKPQRSPGWCKIKSMEPNRRGAANVEWDPNTAILTCRVVNRGAGRPHQIVGDIVSYFLNRHKRRVQVITVYPPG